MKINTQKLKKRLLPCFVALSLLMVLCSPLTASAEWGKPVNYADLDYKVQYGTDYNTVTFPLPADNYLLKAWNVTQDIVTETYGANKLSFGLRGKVDDDYRLYVYPISTFGLDLSNIPVGATIHMQVKIESEAGAGYNTPTSYCRYYYMDDDGTWLKNAADPIEVAPLTGTYNLDYTIEQVSGATCFVPSLYFKEFSPLADGAKYVIEVVSAEIEMNVSTEFWTQFQNQQNGELLNDMVNGTPEQNEQANQAATEMEQASGKLDDLGDQLNSVAKPAINSSDFNMDTLIGDVNALPLLTAPIVEVWESKTAIGILAIVVSLVLVSWVFFGQKR